MINRIAYISILLVWGCNALIEKTAPLEGEFYIRPEDWIEEKSMFQLGGDQSNLETPGVNPALMTQVMPGQDVMETGLTPTEQALLSNEEKAIRLRQRGMTA